MRQVTSVILVTYERYAATKRCVEAVLENTNNCDLIIVDNGSRREVQDFVYKCPAIRIFLPENRGLYKALNLGVSVARGEHVAFLDADIVVRGGWLEALLEVVSSAGDIGLAGSRYLNGDGTLQEGFPVLRRDGYYGENKQDLSKTRACQYIAIGCSVWKKSAWEKVGGFDEDYFISHGDIDFCYKLRYEGGFRVMYAPSSTVVHDHDFGREGDYEMVRWNEATVGRDFQRFVSKWKSKYTHEKVV